MITCGMFQANSTLTFCPFPRRQAPPLPIPRDFRKTLHGGRFSRRCRRSRERWIPAQCSTPAKKDNRDFLAFRHGYMRPRRQQSPKWSANDVRYQSSIPPNGPENATICLKLKWGCFHVDTPCQSAQSAIDRPQEDCSRSSVPSPPMETLQQRKRQMSS